jgi:hypothetical protein
MSLDIRLEQENNKTYTKEKIYIRENGQNKEISLDEWKKKFPSKIPFVVVKEEGNIVYSANITHNLGKMAKKTNLYMYLWRPEEIEITYAKQLIKPLEEGLVFLQNNKEYLEQFNPENGWGDYNILLEFVIDYLEHCKLYPDAKVVASR